MKMVSNQNKRLNQKVWHSFSVEVPIDEGVEVEYKDNIVFVKGPKGENSKRLKFPGVFIRVEGDNVVIGTDKFSRKNKKIITTYRALIKNLILGVKEGFVYNLVVVYSKFPVSIDFKNDEFIVKNLLGEKVPRVYKKSYQDVEVQIKGKDVTVSGVDKERTGQVAASIEQLCRFNNLDRRVVQDGIYITRKPHRDYV